MSDRIEEVSAGPSEVTPTILLLEIDMSDIIDMSEATINGCHQPQTPTSTPVVSTPVTSPVSSKGQRKRLCADAAGSDRKKSRRSLINNELLEDSGSECEYADLSQDDIDDVSADKEDEYDGVDFRCLRHHAWELRNRIVVDDPEDLWSWTDMLGMNVGVNEDGMVSERNDERMSESSRSVGSGRDPDAPGIPCFLWSEDFTTFSGQKETYTRVPGPAFASQNPVDIFEKIWDREFMEAVVEETNKYAWQIIYAFSDPDIGIGSPKYLDAWVDVTVEELYRYFAIQICMSFCYCSNITEYWSTGTMGMPAFRELMSRNRFLLITKFLHFVSNENLVTGGNQRKIAKIAPVVNHVNKRFGELYTPGQYLSLDESLLLWKGRLSWRQSIPKKAARFGIKSFELCEADTGYLLQYRLYTGKSDDMHPDTSHGFHNHTAKVVVDLIEGYLDVGHVLVMDNWYNQLSLTRYLKTRRTDVLGTISRRRNGIPSAIKNLIPNQMERGEMVSRHCGDMALVAWRDVKLVTIISTYHQPLMVPGIRAGQPFQKPEVIHEYNRYMGGVDLKDQKLSLYLMERKRNLKWYMKVFRRLLNASLLNAFIIYRKNPMFRVYSHRQFRWMVAEGLLSRYPRVSPVFPRRVLDTTLSRLQPGEHFPIHTESVPGPGSGKHKQLRCVRCSAQKRRVTSTYRCKLCMVPLCIGQCWEDYHRLKNLKATPRKYKNSPGKSDSPGKSGNPGKSDSPRKSNSRRKTANPRKIASTSKTASPL